jgi:DNA (cytosine-5)-methyltransferase 1
LTADFLLGSQPHSTLNRFSKEDDPKSNLILTTLGYINYLEPKHVVIENVAGFLSYNVGAISERVKQPKAVRATGFRFLVSALTALGYQVRAAMLNATNFGAPQERKRFFLFAAKAGEPLPLEPYPTHTPAGTRKIALGIRTSEEVAAVEPVHPAPKTYLFKHTTIWDAIGDLWLFDAYASLFPAVVRKG